METARMALAPRLIIGTVQINHGLIDESLLLCIKTDDRFGDFGIDVLYRLHDTLAEVTAGIAITQLNRFAGTGGSTRRNSRPAHDTTLQQHISFNGGIASGI
jgi:hypothetical protein